eukprot:2978712-Amphidinium_carterae.1
MSYDSLPALHLFYPKCLCRSHLRDPDELLLLPVFLGFASHPKKAKACFTETALHPASAGLRPLAFANAA